MPDSRIGQGRSASRMRHRIWARDAPYSRARVEQVEIRRFQAQGGARQDGKKGDNAGDDHQRQIDALKAHPDQDQRRDGDDRRDLQHDGIGIERAFQQPALRKADGDQNAQHGRGDERPATVTQKVETRASISDPALSVRARPMALGDGSGDSAAPANARWPIPSRPAPPRPAPAGNRMSGVRFMPRSATPTLMVRWASMVAGDRRSGRACVSAISAAMRPGRGVITSTRSRDRNFRRRCG